MRGYVGKNGVASRKREGDGKTPAGLFRLGTAFGVREKPDTRMSYRADRGTAQSACAITRTRTPTASS
jgi:L,D-peptidoglycan transpeptidase YkuD (ErfK/YbiS/YcfS/YnhG family)